MYKVDEYQPINCDDYENLELACMHHFQLSLQLCNGENVEATAKDLVLRKHVEYLIVEPRDNPQMELRLDHIVSFSHPQIGTITISDA